MKLDEAMKLDFPKSDAYWISPYRQVMPVGIKHITMISDNPELFGLTKEYVLSMYEKYNERPTIEGKAREELMKELINDGWIRIRRYPSFWSINVKKLKQKSADIIWDWCDLMVNKHKESKYSDIIITNIYDNASEELNFQDVLDFKLFKKLSEAKRNPNAPFHHDQPYREYIKSMLTESGLSRLVDKIKHHAVGIISACRHEYTPEENRKRSFMLMAKLRGKNYDVTQLEGNFIETKVVPIQRIQRKMSKRLVSLYLIGE